MARRNQPEDHGVRAVIDGQSLSLFIDYDRARLAHLTTDGKIEYFRRRFDFLVLEPLTGLLEEQLMPAHRHGKESSVLLIWANGILCAIEALGHFLTPAMASNSQAFRTFVTAFMDSAWEQRAKHPPMGIDTYTRWLWDSFRNGLTHGAYVKNGGFERLGDRLFVETEEGLLVDPWALDVDFRNANRKMHNALAMPENYFRSTFLERFDRTYILGEA